jgi:hypothetical protein
MKQDVWEAAGRLLRVRRGESIYEVYQEGDDEDGSPSPLQEMRDQEKLADTFLDWFFSDEKEPVTEEWLRAAGADILPVDPSWQAVQARFKSSGPRLRGLAVSIAVDGHIAVATVDQFGGKNYLREGPDITVHVVRSFCIGLGIGLK